MDGVNEGGRKRLFTEENSIKGKNIRGTFGGITRTWRGKKKSGGAYSEKGGGGGGDGERVDSRGKKEKRKPPHGCGAMCEWANARGGTKRKEK